MAEDNEIVRRLANIENKIDNQVLRQIEDLKSSAELAKDNNILLGGIGAKLDNISVNISSGISELKDTITKVILALIGVIAATIGVRAVGSPLWLDIYTFMVILSLVFVLLESFYRRIWFRFITGTAFLSYVLFSILSIDYSMSNRSLSPSAYGAVISFGIGALFLAISAWKGKNK